MDQEEEEAKGDKVAERSEISTLGTSGEILDSTSTGEPSVARRASSRTRQNSIKQFTEKVRLFSTDFLRSIENAHDLVDLKNSNFSAATQSAAAQLCQHHDDPGNNIDNDEDDDVYYKNDSVPKSAGLDTVENERPKDLPPPQPQDATTSHPAPARTKFRSDSILRGVKSIGKEFSKAIDQANAINEYITPSNQIRNSMEPGSRVSFNEDNKQLTESIQLPTPVQPVVQAQPVEKKTGVDQTDFRVKRRQRILRNGLKIAIPDEIHISIFEVFIYMWGVVTFFADLISDIILSVEYYNGGRSWLGTMTLMFVIVPNVTLSLFSLSWYIDNYYSEQAQQASSTSGVSNNKKNRFRTTCDSITFWITTILFVTFQLDLIWKYIQGLVYTIKGWACRSLFKNLDWEKYYIEKQIKCDTDIGMLRLIDVYLDSGPQILLQLYVITTQNLNELGSANLVVFTFKDFQTTSVELKQLVSILSSLFSMAYAVAGYHRCLRNQQFIFCLQTNKPLPKPMSWPSTITQFLWYLSLIAPRVLAMALFASTFRSWFFMIIFTHWLIMYFWILRLKTNYCISSPDVYNAREEIFEKFYDFVCSFIYIFVYFNLKAGRTRYRYLIYYLLFYAENILFVTCYYIFSKDSNHVYKLVMLLVVIVGFWLALTFQIVYYLYCHPSQEITVCVRHKAKFHFIHNETLKPRRRPPQTQATLYNELNSNGVDLCDFRPRRDQDQSQTENL